MSFQNPNLPEPLPGESLDTGMTQQYDQESAGYRPANDSAQSCSNCVHFTRNAQQALGMGLCDIVAGQISPNGVSEFFEPAGGLNSLNAVPQEPMI